MQREPTKQAPFFEAVDSRRLAFFLPVDPHRSLPRSTRLLLEALCYNTGSRFHSVKLRAKGGLPVDANRDDQTLRVVLEQVKQVVLNQLKGKRAKAYLFGSWARNMQRRSSDIDVAIEFECHEESGQETIMNIRHALEDSTIPYHVDVIYLNLADEHIVRKVREEGIEWGEQMNESL